MKERNFELLCIVLLGLGQMSIMTGYDTQSFVQESVIHSVHERDPNIIDKYAGYFGQATCYAAYMIGCLLAPFILTEIGPKKTLFMGALCFVAYQIGFFFLNSYYYYFSCAIMGFGFALFYAGNGGYLTSHSTRQTVEQNSAIVWGIASVCMLNGGTILSVIFSLNDNTSSMHSNFTNVHSNVSSHFDEESIKYRRFSDTEIGYMYGAFTALTVVACFIFFFIPLREIENCIEGKYKKKQSFKKRLNMLLTAFADRKMLMLAINFVHVGLWTSFWVTVYPTALMFTQSLHENKYLVAVYSTGVGLGEITMGVIISIMSRKIKDFGLKPTMSIAFIGTFLVMLIILVSTPQWATIHPTNEDPWLFPPSYPFIVVISFFLGLVDSCVNNVRTVICALALPERRAQTFSISKFYQALGGAVLMFITPFLSIMHYTIILLTSITLSTIFFFIVANETRSMEKKITIEKESIKVAFDDLPKQGI